MSLSDVENPKQRRRNSRFDDTPYSSLLTDTYLSRWNKSTSDAPVIKTVAVVGALFDSKFSLFNDDLRTIEKSFDVLHRAGIPCSPETNFRFYNLLAPIKSDFLRAALVEGEYHKADALIVCGVWGGKSDRYSPSSFHPDQIDKPYENFREIYWDISKGYRHNREVSISHIQSMEGTWAQAANAIGAKVVITRGPTGIDAINSDDFLHGSFYKAAFQTKDQFEHVSATIGGSLGILVHKDAVKDLKAVANPQDALGKRILAM